MLLEKMEENLQFLRQYFTINEKKLRQLTNSNYLHQEIQLIKNKKVLGYYQYIIDKIEIDKNNLENSYVMWLVDKVEKIDFDKPANIIQGKSSLPDIDIDVPLEKRAEILAYIKNKYGYDKVAQMITYQTIKGKAAIKDVLRAYGTFSFDEINRITEHIEDEAKIADDLQEMKEEEGESSIIKWALENKADKFKEWVHLDDGRVVGPLAPQFYIAIRLEGIKSAASKHAAGIVVYPEPLNTSLPMSWDAKSKTQIIGVEMNDCEALGGVKIDLLSIAALDKVMKICTELENNYVV